MKDNYELQAEYETDQWDARALVTIPVLLGLIAMCVTPVLALYFKVLHQQVLATWATLP